MVNANGFVVSAQIEASFVYSLVVSELAGLLTLCYRDSTEHFSVQLKLVDVKHV